MKLSLASTAELYAEHRRTGSDRKRQRIAAELQRRHDELMEPFGMFPAGKWWVPNGFEIVHTPLGPATEPVYFSIWRFDFALQLPGSQPSTRNSQLRAQ